MVGWAEMPRSPMCFTAVGADRGRLRRLCRGAADPITGQDGRALVPPDFRMHLTSSIGAERCSDSLSLREFLRLENRERVPDHSWLSRTRTRLPHEVHTAIFDWVLALIAEAGLVKGDRIGVDLDHGGQRGAAQHRAGTRARVLERLFDTAEDYWDFTAKHFLQA